MSTALPIRSRDYVGPITNTDSWDAFHFRPGDIVLSTPPKCGTTWSQAIFMSLIHGRAETDRDIWHDSKWLDCAFRDRPEMANALDAQPHRRCIKSHTPFDGIKYDPQTIYVTVYRHPIDVHFSFKEHAKNTASGFLDFMFPPEPGAAFARFVDGPLTETGTDDLTAASIVHHYLSFRKWAHLPNVHMLHYADHKRDTPAQIRRMADLAGISASESLIADITAATSFKSMKAITEKAVVESGQGAFRNPADFFNSATSNKWEGRLSERELASYDVRMRTLLDEQDRAWLEFGDQALSH